MLLVPALVVLEPCTVVVGSQLEQELEEVGSEVRLHVHELSTWGGPVARQSGPCLSGLHGLERGSPAASGHTGGVSSHGADNAAAPVDAQGEAARRRTFAIISHPDAGKTTLTEKFLLYGGALTAGAGAVRAKGERRRPLRTGRSWNAAGASPSPRPWSSSRTSDRVLNLLDTPGHGDFSEDTYRVLSAVDSAVMVLDGAKGIEVQTRKLFEVCRNREIPIVTFINKWDRPARDPLELLDEIEDQLVLDPVPVTWPVGEGDRFRGLIDRRSGHFVRFTRTAGGATTADEQILDAGRVESEEGEAWHEAREAVELLDAASAELDVSASRRASSRRCSTARPSPTSVSGCCSTPSSIWLPPPAPASTLTAIPARWTHPSARWCSRCSPTWTRPTETEWRSYGCARAGSSGAWQSPAGAPARPWQRSTPTRWWAGTAAPRRRPGPAT